VTGSPGDERGGNSVTTAEHPPRPPRRQDTVADAAATPDREQPYQQLGLDAGEYAQIRDILGRRPTDAELAIYSVMWSEHCSYKSSKVHLRQLAAKMPRSDALLAGMGQNAGVVDVGQGYAVTFKIESHNHPSYVEPHQGAATGVGGIVRDILAMGARPVAVMDALRFGPADAPDTRRVLPGVVSGISFYGNCLGLPNIGGELAFDPCYAGNPLVNALCVGVMRHSDLKHATASGPGNKVILFGSRTGPDGIGGASVLASAAFADADGSGAKRPSVQVGDPFMEKLLVECSLELFGAGIVAGIQDLGAAGISCATAELAAAGTGGMRVELDAVPLRDPSLGPAEILMSESQERMMAVTEPGSVERFMEICAKWDVPATVIGEVTNTGRLVMTWRGQVVVDIPPGTAADDAPVYDRPSERPASQDALHGDDPAALARPADGAALKDTLLRLLGSPDLADKTWVTQQYDRYVRGNTVLAMPDDAGVLRIDEETGLGVALAVDGNGRYTRLDPYAGAQLALAEACRNVAASGARPLAVTNCLNFGSPASPAVMWQFAEAVRGLGDACAALGVPVTGGNVSFYNQTEQAAIHPTPVVGVLGVHDDVRDRVTIGFGTEGAAIVLLGQTREEFGGSAWAHVLHGHLGGRPPVVDLEAERRLARLLHAAAAAAHLDSAHDLSDGGLAIALAESCLRRGVGCRVRLPGDPFVWLFSESAARALVAVRPGAEASFARLCRDYGVPGAELGAVGGESLDVAECFTVPLAELASVHEHTLPALFG
jgi:phosphoribosylformylglycinamidine synthase subunit PurL